MTTATELKCPHCGATETKSGPFKNKSSLNTHINIHCPKKPAGQAQGCAHKYALLNGSRPDFARAMNAGYTKYCSKCGDCV